MASYQQLGDKSANLLHDARLTGFRGAVLSPVNYTESELSTITCSVRKERSTFDLVFDPQLYFPKTQRGVLKEWSHLPSDVDTADLDSEAWWAQRVTSVAKIASRLKPNGVCSPAVVPKRFSDEYYALTVQAAVHLNEKTQPLGIRSLQTAVVSLADITDSARCYAIASILSRTPCNEIYLVLAGDIEPRRELQEDSELQGALRLIRSLRDAGASVFVAFCSSDVVLWKAAGAVHCGTGKFFNLRRFTRSRFSEPKEGGGQLPYWFEESLMAFVREGDLVRIEGAGLLSEASRSNPFSAEILDEIKKPKPRPKSGTDKARAVWLRLSWCHYLQWFASMEERLEDGESSPTEILETADRTWQKLDKAKPRIFMEERGNDGAWVRLWLRALNEALPAAGKK